MLILPRQQDYITHKSYSLSAPMRTWGKIQIHVSDVTVSSYSYGMAPTLHFIVKLTLTLFVPTAPYHLNVPVALLAYLIFVANTSMLPIKPTISTPCLSFSTNKSHSQISYLHVCANHRVFFCLTSTRSSFISSPLLCLASFTNIRSRIATAQTIGSYPLKISDAFKSLSSIHFAETDGPIALILPKISLDNGSLNGHASVSNTKT